MANLDAWLTDAGYNVTDLAGQTTLPADISGYKQIWHYGLDNPDTTDEASLEWFVTDGGGLFLSGDWGGLANFGDRGVQDITRALAPADGITDTNDGDQMAAPMPVNPDVIGDIATTPHVLTTWTTDWVGGLAGVPAVNTFATNASGDAAAAAFEVGDVGGRLVDLMDVNWDQSTYDDPSTAPEITENIAAFLGGG